MIGVLHGGPPIPDRARQSCRRWEVPQRTMDDLVVNAIPGARAAGRAGG
jgi:hypothetical protein